MCIVYSVTTKTNKLSLFSILREQLVKSKDLRALILVGPPRGYLEIDPLAVRHLNN